MTRLPIPVGRRDDRGQAALLVVVVTAVVCVALVVALSRLGAAVVARTAAQTAADAAALAGVNGGRGVAGRVAEANGAALVSWRWMGPGDVIVVVVVDGVRATARATTRP